MPTEHSGKNNNSIGQKTKLVSCVVAFAEPESYVVGNSLINSARNYLLSTESLRVVNLVSHGLLTILAAVSIQFRKYKQNKKKLHGLEIRNTHSYEDRVLMLTNSSSFRFKLPGPQVQDFNIFPLLSSVMVFDDVRDRVTFPWCPAFITFCPLNNLFFD